MILCAQSRYANDPKIFLGFGNCLVQSYHDIPAQSLVESCALEHGVNMDELNECLSEDGHGEKLLRNSVLRSREEGVRLSCTIRVDENPWCVRDGGVWKNCSQGHTVEDLVTQVKHLAG